MKMTLLFNDLGGIKGLGRVCSGNWNGSTAWRSEREGRVGEKGVLCLADCRGEGCLDDCC